MYVTIKINWTELDVDKWKWINRTINGFTNFNTGATENTSTLDGCKSKQVVGNHWFGWLGTTGVIELLGFLWIWFGIFCDGENGWEPLVLSNFWICLDITFWIFRDGEDGWESLVLSNSLDFFGYDVWILKFKLCAIL